MLNPDEKNSIASRIPRVPLDPKGPGSSGLSPDLRAPPDFSAFLIKQKEAGGLRIYRHNGMASPMTRIMG
jgi:hypothetical protein